MGVKIHSNFGYMALDAWVLANVIQLGTQDFCARFLNKQNDPCGRQYDQMTQAARSGVANIAEGYGRHQTSRETEMKLVDVARASLNELVGDYYNILLNRGLLPWPRMSAPARFVSSTPIDSPVYEEDWMLESARHILRQKAKFDAYLCSEDLGTAANALLFLSVRCIAMTESFLARRLGEFKQEGGFTENLTAERLDALRQKSAADPEAPVCPDCGAPMVRRMARKGVNAGKEFWSCSNHWTTGCKGARRIE